MASVNRFSFLHFSLDCPFLVSDSLQFWNIYPSIQIAFVYDLGLFAFFFKKNLLSSEKNSRSVETVNVMYTGYLDIAQHSVKDSWLVIQMLVSAKQLRFRIEIQSCGWKARSWRLKKTIRTRNEVLMSLIDFYGQFPSSLYFFYLSSSMEVMTRAELTDRAMQSQRTTWIIQNRP